MCGGLGGGSVSIPQGDCRRAPGPSPPSRLQRSISQPLTLFLHLEGSERLTVSRLPGQADDMQALRVCIWHFLFTSVCVPVSLPMSPPPAAPVSVPGVQSRLAIPLVPHWELIATNGLSSA